MSLIKGGVSLTRFRVMDQLPELTDEFITERLQKNAFVPIDATTEEESVGWVEILDPLSTGFAVHTFNFGQVIAMGLRVDTRRVSAKVVNRYLSLAIAEAEKLTDRPLTGNQKRELKARVRHDLLARTPVVTDVFEVCWFPGEAEVWLVGGGAKLREKLEEIWRSSFNIGLMMKIPFVLARDLLPQDKTMDDLDRAAPSALFGGRR